MPRRDMPGEPLPALVVGTGPGLLLAHGAGGTPELNFPFIDDLARRYTVVAPYYPGTGPTPRAVEPLSIDDLADRVVASAVNAGLSSFVMLGYSLGAAITVRAATRHPDRADALILTAGFARARPALRSMVALWSDLLAVDPGTLAHFLAFAGSGEAALSTLSPADYDRLIEVLSNSPAPSGTPDQVDLVRRADVRADLAHVAVPTLVVVTAADALVAPAHSAELIANIRGASSVEIDSGHLIAAERPAQWQHAIEEFLDVVHPGALQRSEA